MPPDKTADKTSGKTVARPLLWGKPATWPGDCSTGAGGFGDYWRECQLPQAMPVKYKQPGKAVSACRHHGNSIHDT